VLDLYIEKINPANPNQYEVSGQWVDMTLVHETIQVSGADPVELTVRYTRHGPILYDTAEQAAEMRQAWGLELPENFAIAAQWTALQPADIVGAILGFNQAQNWAEFRQAAADFTVPAQNIVYADVDGNIAYQTPGLIPIRQPAHSGQWPVPGWTDEYEWQGYIPFEQLPTALNPERGYIATANNAIVGPDYPYPITREWDLGFRAARIVHLIENAPGPITVEDIQRIHGDNENASASFTLPILLDLPLGPSQNVAIAIDLLANWDARARWAGCPRYLQRFLEAASGPYLPG
jgi:penicillin amidase